MRTQDQNPAFQRFGNLLPDSGLYPARWVDIFSNTDEDLRYCQVEAVFIPRGSDAPDLDRAFWNAFAAYTDPWIADLGNSVAGWMTPGGMRPEHVFGLMLDRGFVDQQELLLAVREFAHIEECGWARRMRDEGLLSDVLRNGAQDREAVLTALRAIARIERGGWVRSMISMFDED